MKRKATSTLFSATATPLASIFGSGFLVIIPILNGSVGPYALWAMAGICALAYGVGEVIRFNIKNFEPLLEQDKAPITALRFEQTADFALIIAYTISVCLYLSILAAFLMHGLGVDDPVYEHVVTVSVIAIIGVVGRIKGLEMLQFLEKYALAITMVIIAALLTGFLFYDLGANAGAGIQMPALPKHSLWEIFTILGGTLIVVQGFETSRYLGEEYDRGLRIRTSRLSQIISTAVYLCFVALALPLMHFISGSVNDSSLIVLAGKASYLLPAPLILAAVLSQFSAAVADTIGGGGNMVEVTKGHVESRHAYMLICGLAVVLAFADTLTIVALASRAFAFYYMLQCLVAINVAEGKLQIIGIALLAAVLGFITLFAIPVS